MKHPDSSQSDFSGPVNRGENHISSDARIDPRATDVEFTTRPENGARALDSAGHRSYLPEAIGSPPATAGAPGLNGGTPAMPAATASAATAASALGLVPKRAVSYLRVSTKRQAEKGGDEGFSIPAQRDANRRKAQALGAFIIKEFADRGESARSANRPELQRMLEYVRDNDIDYVIVHKVDRLARNREDDVEIGRQLRDAGVMLVSTTENIDQSPSGALLHGIMASIAEFYSLNLRNEVVKGMSEKARRGGTTGRAPLGYRNVGQFDENGREVRTVVVDETRGEHVTWAFRQYATGEFSLREIAEALAARGIHTRQTPNVPSKPLTEGVVQKMLTNAYYRGVVTFQGIEYPGRHEPLIDDETFDLVQSILESRRFGERTRVHDHFLKSTLYCGKCGSRMFVQMSKSKSGDIYPYFMCGGRRRKTTDCELKSVLIYQVEEKVEAIYDRLYSQFSPDFRNEIEATIEAEFAQERRYAERGRQDLDVEREKLEREQQRLLQAHYADAIPLDLLKREQDRIRRSLTENARQAELLRTDLEATERTLRLALDMVDNCARAYRLADGHIKKLFNQVFFERLEVIDDDTVTVQLAEPFAALSSHVAHIRQRKIGPKAKSGMSPKGRTAQNSSSARSTAASPFSSWMGLHKHTLVRLEGFEPPTV